MYPCRFMGQMVHIYFSATENFENVTVHFQKMSDGTSEAGNKTKHLMLTF